MPTCTGTDAESGAEDLLNLLLGRLVHAFARFDFAQGGTRWLLSTVYRSLVNQWRMRAIAALPTFKREAFTDHNGSRSGFRFAVHPFFDR